MTKAEADVYVAHYAAQAGATITLAIDGIENVVTVESVDQMGMILSGEFDGAPERRFIPYSRTPVIS